MLDRGQGEDWFASGEIIECIVAVLFLYLFIAHMLTSRNPFIEPKIYLKIVILSQDLSLFSL